MSGFIEQLFASVKKAFLFTGDQKESDENQTLFGSQAKSSESHSGSNDSIDDADNDKHSEVGDNKAMSNVEKLNKQRSNISGNAKLLR